MDKRNYGIDLLRIVSTLMVVMLHIIGIGGVLETCSSGMIEETLWLLYIGIYCAVNCFALISGYILYSQEKRSEGCSRYLELWFQVIFYGVFVCVLFKSCNLGNVEIKDFVKALFPVTFNQYWYFTAYTGVVIFSPWLNLFIERMDKRDSIYFSFVIIVVFSCYSTLAEHLGGNPFNTNMGYSFVWLCVLYMLGAVIKKNEVGIANIKNEYYLIIYIIMLIFSWGWKGFFGKITEYFFGIVWGEELFVSYISPTILISACCLLVYFSRLNIGERMKKVIRYIAPASFGVFLLHVQPLIYENYIVNKFTWINQLTPYVIYPVLIGVTILIFVSCVIVEKMRVLFFKTIKVKSVINRIEIVRKKIIEK